MKKKFILGIVIVIIMFVTYIIFMIQGNFNELNKEPLADININKINDGIYDGEYKKFPVIVKVSVKVVSGHIKDIEIIEHQQGKGLKAEVIIDDVIEKQTLKVDTVSSATFSSKVILKAIENALINAK